MSVAVADRLDEGGVGLGLDTALVTAGSVGVGTALVTAAGVGLGTPLAAPARHAAVAAAITTMNTIRS